MKKLIIILVLCCTPCQAEMIKPISKMPLLKQHQLACLALVVYHESRGLSSKDQVIVAQVVMNRVKSGKFGNSICEVAFAPYQFEWTNNLSRKHLPKEKIAWIKAQKVALAVYRKKVPNYSKGALWFYAPANMDKKPSWSKNMVIASRGDSGQHIYLKQSNSK